MEGASASLEAPADFLLIASLRKPMFVFAHELIDMSGLFVHILKKCFTLNPMFGLLIATSYTTITCSRLDFYNDLMSSINPFYISRWCDKQRKASFWVECYFKYCSHESHIVLAMLNLCAVQKYNKIQLYEFLKGKHCHVQIRCSKGESQNQKHIGLHFRPKLPEKGNLALGKQVFFRIIN